MNNSGTGLYIPYAERQIMQVIKELNNGINPGYPIEKYAPLENILFIDIETTGLSKEHTDLYLIGCGYFNEKGYNTVQWFADSPSEEADIIKAFTEYIKDRFTCLLHYNGNHFDIPYLKYKAEKYGLLDPFLSLESIDIYLMIKPYKRLLALPSLRQRCIEQFLGINSDDPYTGRELINVYRSYIHDPSETLLSPLLYHNSEDLKGMAYILPILYYTSIKDISLKYVSYELHEFHDLNGNLQYELLAYFTHEADIPCGFTTSRGQVRLAIRPDRTALLRLPVYNGELKKFYDNYRDYYYLPEEDCCVLKQAASGVDKNRRENAKKETCYTKHSGLFIPAISSEQSLIFKSDYTSEDLYILYNEKKCPEILINFGASVINYIF